jgi:hypothetical protein
MGFKKNPSRSCYGTTIASRTIFEKLLILYNNTK